MVEDKGGGDMIHGTERAVLSLALSLRRTGRQPTLIVKEMFHIHDAGQIVIYAAKLLGSRTYKRVKNT